MITVCFPFARKTLRLPRCLRRGGISVAERSFSLLDRVKMFVKPMP